MLRHSDLVTLRGAPPAAVVFPLRYGRGEEKFEPLLKNSGPLIEEERTPKDRPDRFTADIALRPDRLFSTRAMRGEVIFNSNKFSF